MFFLCAMGVYLIVVHAWAAGLLSPAALAARLGLLYAAMAATFLLTRPLTGGPWWLGSLSAVLLMAHPLKTDAVIGPGGGAILGESAAALALLAAVAWAAPRRWGLWAGLALGVAAAFLPVGPPGALALIVGLYLGIVAPGGVAGKRAAVAPIGAGLWALTRLHPVEIGAALPRSLVGAVLPVYPVGLLPENAAAMAAAPGLAWALIAAALCGLAWICRRARHPGLTWCAVAMPLWVVVDRAPVDWVSLHGGGRMIVPIALAMAGFAALCRQIMAHPAWGRHVVGLTTLLCLAFFVLQVAALRDARQARDLADAWAAAAGGADSTAHAPIHWRRHGRAPVPAPDPTLLRAWFPFAHARGARVEVAAWGSGGGTLRVHGPGAAALLWPYWPATVWRVGMFRLEPDFTGAVLRFRRADPAPGEATTLRGRIAGADATGVVLEIVGEDGDLPARVVAFP